MPDATQPNPLQLLFIELRVGLARSAIQAALLLNGGAAIAVLLLFGNLLGIPGGASRVDVVLLKTSLATFGAGLFLAAITFVNAYVAQGAIASGKAGSFGNAMRRLGLGLIVVSLASFLLGVGFVVAAI